MIKTFQFIQSEQEYIHIEVPVGLRGKLVEIVIQEKAPDPDTHLDSTDEEKMERKEAELQLMDKLRNQLNNWDI
ncbi:MAG: hypothetical protein R2794_09235 [Chitinophagales bacterium]